MSRSAYIRCLLVLVMAVAVGCKSHPQLQSSTHTTVTDTVVVTRTVTERDTVIVTPAASVGTTFDCDSLVKVIQTGIKTPSKPIVKRSGHASLVIKADSTGRLDLAANCDSLEQVLRLRDTTIHELRKRQQNTENTTLVPAPFVPWYI